MSLDFIHLRVHSEYSISEGMIAPAELPDLAIGQGMPAIALTDIDNCFGLIKFYRAALAKGVKPILGADVHVAGVTEDDEPAILSLLVCEDCGLSNLYRLISRAWRDSGRQRGVAVRRDWLNSDSTAGLIALSGGARGDVGRALLRGSKELAEKQLKYWRDLFDDRYYLELQRLDRAGEENYLAAAAELAASADCPVVATNEVCFKQSEHFEFHEARVCIGDKRILSDRNRPRLHSAGQYLRSAQEMAELFADIPSALSNTVEIARRCNVQLNFDGHILPRLPGVSSDKESEQLLEDARDGLKQRIDAAGPGGLAADSDSYQQRLQEELAIIEKTGYAGYFLIVMDFVRWARDNSIPVGPGRGSGVGSVVAWSLKITDIDPLRYGLLFERFLNPERVGMPDFDIDFCQERRDKVLEYVSERYGSHSVAGIITYNRMAARAVLRDTARVLGKSYGLGDSLARLIPGRPGTTLEDALNAGVNRFHADELKKLLGADPEAQEIWNTAIELEGLVRNAGRHAGGIVIAPGELTDHTPLYCDERSAGDEGGDQGARMLTQFDKDDIEKCGLVKFDFLGLRTLTVIDRCLRLIQDASLIGREDLPTTDKVQLDDADVFEMLSKGDTTAVFQLESAGMRELIRSMQPNRFEDIIALVALYRPGPLDKNMHKDYVERKAGREDVVYLHPLLESVLDETYGVFIYQEQVINCARVLAGYSYGGADLLRRAMGKKDPVEMARQRDIFVTGAKKHNNVNKSLAGDIFDQMETFAGYGFNKSHAAAYALLAYHTAWLKCHYPAQYLTAEMSTDMENTDRLPPLVRACAQQEIELLRPDINSSDYEFEVVAAGEQQKPSIRYGLGAIKGLGRKLAQDIVAERGRDGEYRSLLDFCHRVGPRTLGGRKVLEALIGAGAMDCLGERYQLMGSLDTDLRAAEQRADAQAGGLQELFGGLETTVVAPTGEEPTLLEWSSRVKAAHEYKALGLYLTEHPAEMHRTVAEKHGAVKIAELEPGPERVVMGLVDERRIRRGLLIVVLSDSTGVMDLILDNDAHEKFGNDFSKGCIVLVQGKVEDSTSVPGQVRMRPDQVESLGDERGILSLHLRAEDCNEDRIKRLRQLLETAPSGDGGNDMGLRFQLSLGVTEVQLPAPKWRVGALDPQLLRQLQNELGDKCVQVL